MKKREKIIRRLEYEIDSKTIKKELMSIILPKWPALVVSGNNVTKEQAKEIIIRTGPAYLCSNDKDFERQIYEVMGISLEEENEYSCRPNFDDIDKVSKDLKILPLEYMRNQRVLSTWIGGPHGWCSWDGVIFANNYNIGKWPSCDTIFEELVTISQAFPFLDMSCQLFSGETYEEGTKCVVQFDVYDGLVDVIEPRRLAPPSSDSVMDNIHNLRNPLRERGCTIEQFIDAFNFVKEKYSDEKKRDSVDSD